MHKHMVETVVATYQVKFAGGLIKTYQVKNEIGSAVMETTSILQDMYGTELTRRIQDTRQQEKAKKDEEQYLAEKVE